MALGLVGLIALFNLSVAPLPQIEFPTLQVSASLPGASPEVIASSIATPLERQLGQISGITEMSSSSSLGGTSIVLQFDLDRDIDAAARDVDAAIHAARSTLPANLPQLPSYRKVNPADTPVVILVLSSTTYPRSALYEFASSSLQQQLSQIPGVGQVMIGGSALPGIRITLDPSYLNHFGLGLDEVRKLIQSESLKAPAGVIESSANRWILSVNDQLRDLEDYENLRIRTASGSLIRLGDIAEVSHEAEDARAVGFRGNEPCVMLMVNRQPGANIIETAEHVKSMLPALKAQIPAAMNLDIAIDRTLTIRASVDDVKLSLIVSVLLVVGVVYLFLGRLRNTLIPVIAIPVSILGTFGVMYLLGYSINNLTLMALTVATGFVVDDAIVVTENISRHLRSGLGAREAALRGSREIGFTVLSISLSLVAVFLPLLLMEGMLGRLFREFSVTLATSVLISMVISLVTTPMLCAVFLTSSDDSGELSGFERRIFSVLATIEKAYRSSLIWCLDHKTLILMLTLATLIATLKLYMLIPKGFFPQQDTGRLIGQVISDQQSSFRAMEVRLREYLRILGDDPAVKVAVGFAGGGGPSGGGAAGNSARVFAALRPLEERQIDADAVMARLRPKMKSIAGGQLFLQPPQDLRIGGRMSATQWQYTLTATRLEDLRIWAPRLLEALKQTPFITDLNMDQQEGGLTAHVEIDRDKAMRLGISIQAIDDALYDAFGQRQISNVYDRLNQTHVILSVPLESAQNRDALDHIHLKSGAGRSVPLSELASIRSIPVPLTVSHSGQLPSTTLSFNLVPGHSLSDALSKIHAIAEEINLPVEVKGRFQGAALAFQSSMTTLPLLLLAAILSVFIVLSILYEDLLQPLTILSTLPSAGVGALLALMMFKLELNVIGIIGIILLIGIVKKNAIMMIDFALEQSRESGLAHREAILEASILRFRPILMTTLAALFGALPMALGHGPGYEIRMPLGVSIVGGLLLSQIMTLYSTPVIYLAMESLRTRMVRLTATARGIFKAS